MQALSVSCQRAETPLDFSGDMIVGPEHLSFPVIWIIVTHRCTQTSSHGYSHCIVRPA